MKRSGFTWWEWLASGAVLLIVAAILFPVFARSRENAKSPRSACTNNLKQMGLALSQYSQDWDERLPLISVTPITTIIASPRSSTTMTYGWADALFPYLKSYRIYQCPTEGGSGFPSPMARGFTDYWLNSHLAALELKTANAPSQTIVFGDGNDKRDISNARYNLPSLPPAWLADSNSPSYRHSWVADYAFMDGHVKAFAPDQLSNGPTKVNYPTFSPK